LTKYQNKKSEIKEVKHKSMFGPKQIEPAGLRPNSASAFFGLGAALDPAGDPAGHCFFTRRRA
jgi:hypothetical protein